MEKTKAMERLEAAKSSRALLYRERNRARNGAMIVGGALCGVVTLCTSLLTSFASKAGYKTREIERVNKEVLDATAEVLRDARQAEWE